MVVDRVDRRQDAEEDAAGLQRRADRRERPVDVADVGHDERVDRHGDVEPAGEVVQVAHRPVEELTRPASVPEPLLRRRDHAGGEVQREDPAEPPDQVGQQRAGAAAEVGDGVRARHRATPRSRRAAGSRRRGGTGRGRGRHTASAWRLQWRPWALVSSGGGFGTAGRRVMPVDILIPAIRSDPDPGRSRGRGRDRGRAGWGRSGGRRSPAPSGAQRRRGGSSWGSLASGRA